MRQSPLSLFAPITRPRLEFARVIPALATSLILLASARPAPSQSQPFPTASQPDSWIDTSGTTQTRRALHSPNSLPWCSGNWNGQSDPRPCSCTGGFPPCSGPNPKVQLRVSGGHIVVDYDAPNLYCENDGSWPPGYPNGPAPFYLQVTQGASSISTWIYYEYGTWDTGWTIACDGFAHGTYIATISYSCSPLNGTLSATDTQTVSCPPPQSAPACGFGGASQGPGGVSIGPNEPATWTEAPIAGPLAPAFFYNGGNTSSSDTGLAPGWFFDYGESLRPAGTGTLVWTDRLGFRRTFVGSDANGYVATDPGDARGSVALAGSNYVLTTPNGTSRTFVANSNGYWVKTVDRWGNGSQGNTTNSVRPTTVSELFGGVTTGRQVSLVFNAGQLGTVTDAGGGTTQLLYDGSARLSTICAADQTCPTANPWRTFQYDGASSRLSFVKDSQGFYRRGYTYNASGGVDTTWVGSATFTAGKERTKYVPTGPTVAVQRYKDDGTTADTTYTYSAIAGLYRVTQISGACPECGDENSTTTFDPTFGFPTSRADGNGHTTKKTYDGLGNVKTVTEAYGTSLARTAAYTYADPALDALPSAWAGAVRDFWKTKTLLLASVRPGQSVTMSRTWSGSSNLKLTETTSGYLAASDSVATSRSTITTHDANGRVTQFDGPRTDVIDWTTYTYYTNGETSVAARNRLKQRTDPVGIVITYDTYHPLGGVIQQTAKKGSLGSDADIVSQSGYDSRGRLLTRTLKATPSTSEQDLITTNAYDARGRLASTAVNAGVSPATTKTLYVYEDGTDRMLTRTESTQPSPFPGDRVTYGYDNQGNVSSEAYGYFDGTLTSIDYQVTKYFDARCHVKSQTYPVDNATTQYTYDCVGNLLTVQDSLHSSPNVTYLYDELNRLKQVTRTATPSNDVTTYAYDAMDHLIQVTDPNLNSTFYTYDDFGALRQQTTTLAGGGQLDITTNGYDPANNLVATGNGQASTRRNYDAANRLLTVKSTSGPLTYTAYTYDTGCLTDPTTWNTFGIGRVCRMTDTSGTTTYGYDRRGLVAAEAKVLIGANHTYIPFFYSYDAAGRRTGGTYPTGDAITTTYSDSSRPVSMSFTPSGGTPSTLFSSISHKPFGPITGFTTAGGVVEARTFDTRYRRLSQTTGAGPLMGLNYSSYDTEGNPLTLNDTVNPGSNRTFGYDPNRYFLSSSTGPYGTAYASLSLSWTYDGAGNRLTETRGASTTTYGYGNDGAGHNNGVLASLTPGGAVTSLSTGDLSVDENGATHVYDAFGRLSRVYDPACRATRFNAFWHDGNGQRVMRTSQDCNLPSSLKREDFLYASDGKLLLYEPFNSADAATGREEYIYLEDEPVAIVRAGFTSDNGTFFLHGDQLGRPLAMTSSAGALAWRAEYEPFGKSLAPRTNSLSFAPRFRFPGQWENADSGDVPGGASGILGTINGLTDNWHRTYTQRWGRYTQPDPIGLQGGINLFAYAGIDPIGSTDSLGLFRSGQVCCRKTPETGGGSGADVFVIVYDPAGDNNTQMNGGVRVATFGPDSSRPGGCGMVYIGPIWGHVGGVRDPWHRSTRVWCTQTFIENPGPNAEQTVRRRARDWAKPGRCYGYDKQCSDFTYFVVNGRSPFLGGDVPTTAFCGR